MVEIASGLIFTEDHVRTAREHRGQHPFVDAWDAFERMSAAPDALTEPLLAATADALNWRLTGNPQAGERAVEALAALVYSAANTDIHLWRCAFSAAQAIACVSDHAAMTEPVRARILDAWQAYTSALTPGEGPHSWAWSALLGLCSGILLDQPAQLEMAAAQYRAMVDLIQPHGYVSAIVGAKDSATLERTLQFVQAMVLTAEAASHHGVDLWSYERRGVSVMTAALYPLYYFYYPEKWPWSTRAEPEPMTTKRRSRRERANAVLSDLTVETARPIFVQYASFLELVNRRSAQPIHAVNLILDELRPIIDFAGGGPVTLTHAPVPPKRRGLFGR